MDGFLPGSASLADIVDRKILVILRDGRKLTGYLRAYDQFANLTVQDCIERIYVDDSFGEEYRGMFVIRGENVVLLGEVDEEREEQVLSTLKSDTPAKEIAKIAKARAELASRKESARKKVLHNRGFSVDVSEHDHY
ncbi:SM-like, degradation of cytoplasmic mRNAs and positively regulates transcription initiation [Chytridiales sp. JEL 0842]|nr:SM-like, degradation of cytoplasmic mRNAs and positively regulates transcription initiation [Chytridiales sp. JEL 0842]